MSCNDVIGQHPSKSGPVTALCVYPGASDILVGYHNGIVALRHWNAFSTESGLEIAAHRGAVSGILPLESSMAAPVADGDADDKVDAAAGQQQCTCITSSGDGDIKAWNLPSGEWVTTLSGHEGHVQRVAAVRDGDKTTIYSTGSDGTLRVWDLEGGVCIHSLRCHVGRITALFLPAEWPKAPETTEAAPVAGQEVPPDSVVYVQGRQPVFTGSDDSLVKLIDPKSKTISAIYKTDAGVLDVQLLYPTLFAAGSDGVIRGFNSETARPTIILRGHRDAVNALGVHLGNGSSRYLLSLSDDTTVTWWDQTSWTPTHVFRGHTKSVLCCASDSKGQRIFTAGFDGAVRVWDAAPINERLMATEQAAAEAAAAAKAKKKKADPKPSPKRGRR